MLCKFEQVLFLCYDAPIIRNSPARSLALLVTQHKKSTCKCLDPTKPVGLEDNQQWARVHHGNKEAAQGALDVDVVFYGDSIVEGWKGTSWGRKNAKVHNVPSVFQSLFSIENGGEYSGTALGIAGDSVSGE